MAILYRTIISQVDILKTDQIYDDKSLYILENIESNFKISRRIYAILYQDICHAFQELLQFLDFDEIQALNLNIQANGGGMLLIENYADPTELLQVFDLFYYMNGRFLFTTGLLPIPDGDFPAFVGDQKISIKKLCKQFRSGLSHGIAALPFICALNLFLSCDPEK